MNNHLQHMLIWGGGFGLQSSFYYASINPLSEKIEPVDEEVDPTIYIKVELGDEVKFVPVVTVGEFGVEPDLTKPIYKGDPVANNAEDSAIAVQKARVIFEVIDTCSCQFTA